MYEEGVKVLKFPKTSRKSWSKYFLQFSTRLYSFRSPDVNKTRSLLIETL